jgi:hypothetical protein
MTRTADGAPLVYGLRPDPQGYANPHFIAEGRPAA